MNRLAMFLGVLIVGIIHSALLSPSRPKHLDCLFLDHKWPYFKELLSTCYIHEQFIEETGILVNSQGRLASQGLTIENNQNVAFLPEQIDINFPTLIAYQVFNCSVKLVEAKHLKQMENLILLNLQRNQIEKIASDAFKDLHKLEQLNLGWNKLSNLPVNLFSKLTNLVELHLQGNQIKVFHENQFTNLVNMRQLVASNNQIENLPENLLASVTSLRNFKVSNNRLTTLSDDFFAHNLNLESIEMDGNTFKVLSGKLFDNKKSLQFVNLRDNHCVNAEFKADRCSEPSWNVCLNKALTNCQIPVLSLENVPTNPATEFIDLTKSESKPPTRLSSKEEATIITALALLMITSLYLFSLMVQKCSRPKLDSSGEHF